MAESADIREEYAAYLVSTLRYEIERTLAGNDGKTLVY
jgi:hypothetical protein